MHQKPAGSGSFKPVLKRDNKFNPLMVNFPSPMAWVEDGVDHINIAYDASTELGRLLSHGSSLTLKHSIFGLFSNIESFWYYIQSNERDDSIRKLSGPPLIKFAKQLTRSRVINFRAIILDANYQRIKQNDALLEMFVNSSLPFDCYRTNDSGIRIRPEYFKWLLTGLKEIREALIENREPNFHFYKDDNSADIYYHLLPRNKRVK